ncbi:hypothetical protein PVT68_03330 [Microbulbifer bruguierae]|uniref:Uncharacterized protein n=1 Tax=Microbulbifer bruguierae TaxID=3029061 RepID=A0ABY8NEJ0_9GAMM|nr:DUF1302 family protein [Microbulbifer bruguierae]WGL17336.1 hypothetical protein PVT68_03330 [Microbulbifer bruguierae]
MPCTPQPHQCFHSSLLAGGLILSSPILAETGALENLSGQWQLEWAGNKQHSQKLEGQLQLEWEHRFNRGVLDNTAVTAIGRLRLDAEDHLSLDAESPNFSPASKPLTKTAHRQLELRELYLDTEWFGLYWRLGKQQVVWGQADGLKVLDVVTPQSYREFILDEFDDSRISLWMINVEREITENASLQFLWIPDTTYHELAEPGTIYQITSPLRTPSPLSVQQHVGTIVSYPADKPEHWLQDSDAGLRYTQFWRGWDISLNYLYHYRDFYVPYHSLSQPTSETGATLSIFPQYERAHLLGGTASNAFGNLTLRTEIGWYNHSYQIAAYRNDNPGEDNQGIEESPELSSVIGLDWQGFSDSLISLQWFQSLMTDYHPGMIRDRSEQTLSVLLERQYAQSTWTFSLQGLYSLNRNDQLWRPRISYLWLSDLEVWIGGEIFDGTPEGLYGQFDGNDRFTIGFEWGI